MKKPSLLAVFALLVACAGAPAQNVDLSKNAQSVVKLDGLWRFHVGDDSHWAEPALDDSHWALLRADENWARQFQQKSDDVEGRTKIYESMVKGENTLEAGTPASFDVLTNEIRGLGLNMQLEKKRL